MITSATNNLIKQVCSLHQKKGRQELQLFLAEGVHLVQEALAAKADIKQYFWTSKILNTPEGERILNQLAKVANGFEVSETVLAKLAETENPQGIVAVLAIPNDSNRDLSTVKLGLILDRLQDPGNLGTIIRTAWAAGVDRIILTPGTADPFQGKVVRASQGGIFWQNIFIDQAPEAIIALAESAGLSIIAGDLKATEPYYLCDLRGPALFLLGNEGQGIDAQWYKYSLKKVYIPQPGRANSLNVAVATGIILYEALRQRNIKSL